MRRFSRHHITDPSIIRNDSRKCLLDYAEQEDIDEKYVWETNSDTTQDKATQVTESTLRAKDVQIPEASCPLEMLPLEIIRHIFGMLDVVSLICLRMTSQRLRHLAIVKRLQLHRCIMWRVKCLLEKDSRAKGVPLPQRLVCAFCKRTHHQRMFGLPGSDVGYGIACLNMTKSDPEIRHCWLHMPKRFCYSPTFRDSQQENWARSLERERWIRTLHMTCLHCGTRLEKNVHSGEEECPACTRKCDVCGYIELPILSRFGPERRFESFKCLRLVKRKKAGFMLEMEDRNSIGREPKGVKYSRHSFIDTDVSENDLYCASRK